MTKVENDYDSQCELLVEHMETRLAERFKSIQVYLAQEFTDEQTILRDLIRRNWPRPPLTSMDLGNGSTHLISPRSVQFEDQPMAAPTLKSPRSLPASPMLKSPRTLAQAPPVAVSPVPVATRSRELEIGALRMEVAKRDAQIQQLEGALSTGMTQQSCFSTGVHSTASSPLVSIAAPAGGGCLGRGRDFKLSAITRTQPPLPFLRSRSVSPAPTKFEASIVGTQQIGTPRYRTQASPVAALRQISRENSVRSLSPPALRALPGQTVSVSTRSTPRILGR